MPNIAIIPARSGSKGLPDKNIKELCGKPLMGYSIVSAINSGMFEVVMVSTDSEIYADVGRAYGADVPFLRSERMSTDSASSVEVILEVLDGYGKMGQRFDTFCLLQPTSPLRNDKDIIEAYRIYRENSAFSVVSVTELEHPLAWCGTLGRDNSLDGFMCRSEDGQRQKQKRYYRPNGAIYLASVPDFYDDSFLYRARSYAYVMPKERSADIDTEFDFKFAEFLMSQNNVRM